MNLQITSKDPSSHVFESQKQTGIFFLISPSHCPVRASIRLMTMSISVAPSLTAERTSCSRLSSGVWPAGKPVATDEQRAQDLHTHCGLCGSTADAGVVVPEATGRLEFAAFSERTASATREGYTHTAAVVIPVTREEVDMKQSVSPSAG